MEHAAPVGRAVSDMMTALGYHDAMRAFAVDFLTRVLQEHGGNRTRTAAVLGLRRAYLHRLIREHGIDVPSDPRTYVYRRGPKHCGHCGRPGHNARTCA